MNTKPTDINLNEYLAANKAPCVICTLDNISKGDQKDITKIGNLINEIDRKGNKPWKWSKNSKYSHLVHWTNPEFILESPGEEDRVFYVEHCEFFLNKRFKNCFIFELVFEWDTGNHIILTGYRTEDGKFLPAFELCPYVKDSRKKYSKSLNKDIRYLKSVMAL